MWVQYGSGTFSQARTCARQRRRITERSGACISLPQLGDRLLSDIDKRVVLDMKATLQGSPGAKAAGAQEREAPLGALGS